MSPAMQRNLDSNLPTPVTPVSELAERQLRGQPYLALRNVRCDYHDGVLTLRGALPTYYLKQRAQEAVSRLQGVLRIDNQIAVLPPASRVAYQA